MALSKQQTPTTKVSEDIMEIGYECHQCGEKFIQRKSFNHHTLVKHRVKFQRKREIQKEMKQLEKIARKKLKMALKRSEQNKKAEEAQSDVEIIDVTPPTIDEQKKQTLEKLRKFEEKLPERWGESTGNQNYVAEFMKLTDEIPNILRVAEVELVINFVYELEQVDFLCTIDNRSEVLTCLIAIIRFTINRGSIYEKGENDLLKTRHHVRIDVVPDLSNMLESLNGAKRVAEYMEYGFYYTESMYRLARDIVSFDIPIKQGKTLISMCFALADIDFAQVHAVVKNEGSIPKNWVVFGGTVISSIFEGHVIQHSKRNVDPDVVVAIGTHVPKVWGPMSGQLKYDSWACVCETDMGMGKTEPLGMAVVYRKLYIDEDFQHSVLNATCGAFLATKRCLTEDYSTPIPRILNYKLEQVPQLVIQPNCNFVQTVGEYFKTVYAAPVKYPDITVLDGWKMNDYLKPYDLLTPSRIWGGAPRVRRGVWLEEAEMIGVVTKQPTTNNIMHGHEKLSMDEYVIRRACGESENVVYTSHGHVREWWLTLKFMKNNSHTCRQEISRH